jgi:phospholipid/cholesterol/gamma-HCH transport system ATP-binding protein
MVSCYHIADRVALLNEGRVHFYGTVEDLKRTADPVVRDFVDGRSDEAD